MRRFVNAGINGGIIALGLATVLASVVAAENATVEPRITRVALFKNGLGFFNSTVVLTNNATTVTLGQLPVPTHGTFWVGYSDDVKVRSMVASMETVEEQVPVNDVGQLLAANPGRQITIRSTSDKDGGVIQGRIVKMVSDTPPDEPPTPYRMSVRASDYPGRNTYGRVSPAFILVETTNGLVALNAGYMSRAEFSGTNIVTTIAGRSKRPTIRLTLEKPARGGTLGLTYLAKGITWTPGYLIDLSDAENAVFTANAIVVNEVADLTDVALDLVTGFPNIKFGEVLSPIAMSQPLAEFLNSLVSGTTDARRGGRYGGQHTMQQAMVMNAPAYDTGYGTAPLPAYSTAVEGTSAEDLFLYPVKSFSLKRGETAYLPLFTAKMPYKHLYTWKIGDYLDAEDRYRSNRPNEEGREAEVVWHCCRLSNNMKMPLTTAATQFLKQGQFTGQDVCYYTAPGAQTTIRINRAMNVVAEEAEVEVERQRNASTFYGYHYDLVKVRGELRVRNRVNTPVNIEITKELSGTVNELGADGKDTQTAKGLRQVNPRHVIVWQIDVKPGEEQKTTYIYSVYIRN